METKGRYAHYGTVQWSPNRPWRRPTRLFRDVRRRHNREAHSGAAVAYDRQDGSGREIVGWHRTRLQQPPRSHHRIQPGIETCSWTGKPFDRARYRNRESRRPCRGPDTAVISLQPATDSYTHGLKPERPRR